LIIGFGAYSVGASGIDISPSSVGMADTSGIGVSVTSSVGAPRTDIGTTGLGMSDASGIVVGIGDVV
jgi:hypothetical protein